MLNSKLSSALSVVNSVNNSGTNLRINSPVRKSFFWFVFCLALFIFFYESLKRSIYISFQCILYLMNDIYFFFHIDTQKISKNHYISNPIRFSFSLIILSRFTDNLTWSLWSYSLGLAHGSRTPPNWSPNTGTTTPWLCCLQGRKCPSFL